MLELTEAAGHEVLCACEMCVYVCVCMHMCARAQARFSAVGVHFLDQLLIEVHEPRRINNSSSESSIPWLNISLGEKKTKKRTRSSYPITAYVCVLICIFYVCIEV